MPVTCPVKFEPLTEAEMKALDYAVMKHAFASHNELGRLCDEIVYQNDLAARLQAAGFSVRSQVPVHVTHRDFHKPYFLDLVVNERLLYELKAALTLIGDHDKQTLHYLFLLGGRYGKLVNFRPASVEHRIVNAVVSPEEQRRYELVLARWRAVEPRAALLRDVLVELCDAFGAYLEVSFYEEAVTHFLGGESAVLRRVTLTRDGLPLGPQAVHHLTEDTGFKLTAYTHPSEHAEVHVRRFFALTPLRVLHWINFNRHHLELVTLEK